MMEADDRNVAVNVHATPEAKRPPNGNGLRPPSAAAGPGGDSPVSTDEDRGHDSDQQEATPLKEKGEEAGVRYPLHYEEDNTDELDDSSSYSDKLAALAHKCRLTPKKSLIYLLVCAALIFILLFILITLAALWPNSLPDNLCESSKCHSLSAKLLGSMNGSIHPCENFWEFSCGGWLASNPIPKSKSLWSEEKLQQFKLKERIRSLISTQPYASESNSVNMKMKKFYSSCMALDYIEADQEKPLKKNIQKLGGWKVLRTFRQTDFDFTRVLKKLQAEHRTSPFFEVQVVPDPRIPEKNIIKISPSGLSLPDKSYYSSHEHSVAASFRTYVKDVVQLLGATSATSSQFADEIFHYEQRIASVTPDKLNYSDSMAMFHKMKLYELKGMSNSIFWDDILKAIFPKVRLHDQTEILVPFPKYLEDISSIISTTDKGNLNNYLMWHYTHKHLPYLSKQFTEAREMYRRESTGSLEPIPRWEFCIDETIWVFSHAVNALLANNCDDRAAKISKVESVFETMKASLTQRIQETQRFDETLRNFAIDKLRLMTLQVGTTPSLRNHTILVDHYFALDVQKDDYFANTDFAISFLHQMEQIQLVNPSKDSILKSFIGKNMYEIHLLPTANKIVVSEMSLHTDAFDLANNAFKPLLFATIGVEFGEALAAAFGPSQGYHMSNGVLLSERDPKVDELRSLIETKRGCLFSFFSDIRLDDTPYLETTSLDSTIHLAAIQIAFDALRSSGESETLPSLYQFSSDAVFFLAYGQSQCSASTLAFHDMEHAMSNSLSHDHRTRGILRQMVDFSKAFGCSKSSEMYADFSCGYVI